MDALNWRKASYSASNGGGCVEVGTADRVLVRDTQDRTGPALQFSPAAWRKFADQVKRSLASDIHRVGHMLAGDAAARGRRITVLPAHRARRRAASLLRVLGCSASGPGVMGAGVAITTR